MIVFLFWVYLTFLALTLFFAVVDPTNYGLPEYNRSAHLFFSYPVLSFNCSVGVYLVHYFMALDSKSYRVFLILFFVSLSSMLGSGASLLFEARAFDTDILKIAFGDGPMTGVVMAISTYAAGWSARQFHKVNPNVSQRSDN